METQKLLFADGDRLGVFDGEKTVLFESEYIERYRENAERQTKSEEWKFTGEGARFRGDYETYKNRQEQVCSYINAVQWQDGKAVYAFTVNSSSGVYRKDVSDPKAREEHIFTSTDTEILTLHRAGDLLAVTAKEDGVTSSIGTLDLRTGELRTLTGGDSRDANAFFGAGKLIYFDSAGVGRDQNGEFTGKYSPAGVFTLDPATLEIKEQLSDRKFSYIKPKTDKNGDLYCIKRPVKEKRGNPLLEMLLIPVRIFQAIVMFVQFFVVAFTGKSLTSAGDNPARGREQSSRKLFIDGNLVEAEKEYKRNLRTKDKDCGFIPLSWKLIKRSNGREEVIKSGICDFSLTDRGVYCTNGRHIFFIENGKERKIADTKSCLSLAAEGSSEVGEDLFAL